MNTALQMSPLAGLILAVVCLVVGWVARKYAAKKWPNEVEAADALAKAAPARAEALLRDSLDKAKKL